MNLEYGEIVGYLFVLGSRVGNQSCDGLLENDTSTKRWAECLKCKSMCCYDVRELFAFEVYQDCVLFYSNSQR
jgi:hypothetical protein